MARNSNSRLPLNRVGPYAAMLVFIVALVVPTMSATEEPCTFPGFRAEITYVCEIGGQNLRGGPNTIAAWIPGTYCSIAVDGFLNNAQTNCHPAEACTYQAGLPGCAYKPEGYIAQPVVFELEPVDPEAVYQFVTANGEFFNCTFTTVITDGALPPVTITTLVPFDGFPYEDRIFANYRPSPEGRSPTVTVTLLKKGVEAATGRRIVEGRLDYDMGGAPENWSIHAELLPWTNADGQSGGGELVLAPEVPLERVGSRSFTFVSPSGAQQLSVLGVASSCAGRATDDTSIECGCDGTQDPVYFADGNVRVTDVDPLPPIGNQQLVRTYNSDEQVVGLFGRGWTTLLDRRMMRHTDNAEQIVSLVTETNEIVTFRGSGGAFRQTWPTSRAAPGTLNYLSGTYIYRPAGAAEQAVFRESDGRLISIRNATTGRETLISYDMSGLPQTVTDSWSSQSWNLTTNSATRRVSSIVVSDRPDLPWTYSYDSNGNLETAFAPGDVVWRTYDYSANRMTASRDVLGNLIESHTYDTNGYGISSTGPGDEIASIEYNLPGSNAEERITRLTYNNGSIAEYTLRAAGGGWRPVHVSGGCVSCGAGDATYVRDSEGRPILEQAADGYITRTTYEAGRVQSQEGALKPAGCNPQTDPQRCRLGPDALAIASLEATSATVTTTYEFADALWPDRVTATTHPSMRAPAQLRRETYAYHPVTGEVVSSTVQGWTGQIATEHSRVIRKVLYGDVPPCGQDPCPPYDAYAPAFSPGGSFQSAWLSLPQPAYVPRSTDGPRPDVQDLTAFVYYPVHASVPALLRGRLAAVKSAAGHITRYENYDVFGNATRAVDPNGVVTEATFDVFGRTLTTIIKGIAGCDTNVDPLCSTDLTTTFTYSPSSGPLHHQESPGGGVTSYEYDTRGRAWTISRGPSAHDLRERVETTYDPLTGKKSLERTLAHEGGIWVEKTRKAFAYDTQSRLKTLTHADGAAVHYTYDPEDRIATVRDENHAVPNTFYKYDSAGRVASVTQTLADAPNGVIATHYEYDPAGNLITVTDPNGNVTSYVYDDFGQMLRQESAVTGVTTYGYDEAGNLIEFVDANQSMTARSFDALGRVLSAASCRTGLITETVTWTYDDPTSGQYGIGRLATMVDPSGTTAYRYDRRGLLREENGTNTQQAYAYDADGNRTLLGMAQYVFDYAGRPISASAYGTTLVDSVEYHPFGPMTKLIFGNGAVKTVEYDTRYRPERNTLTLGSTVIADYDYQHDDAGNITEIHDAVDAAYSRDFTYDDLNRLVTANTGSALWGNGTYAYDDMGNMTALSLGTSRSLAFSYAGSTPKLSSVSGAPVTYDDAGNENAVISARNLVAFEADVAHYVYDGRGVRVHEALGPFETSTPFSRTSSYSPDLHLLRYDYSSAFQTETTSIVWFNDIPVGQLSSADHPELTEIGDLSMFRYTFTDHLGTPILQMIGNDVVWRAEYEPFGRIYEFRTGSADEQRLRLPGQEATTTSNGDENYYNIFRWYRPSWGRYTQADPIGQLGTLRVRQYPGTLPAPSTFRTGLEGLQRFVWSLSGDYFNSTPSLPASIYAYADSAPTSLIDSLGLEPLLCQVFRKKAQPTPSPLGSLPGNVCQFTGYCGGSNSGQTYKFTDQDPFTYRFLPPCKECPIACIFTWETSDGSLTSGPVCFGKVPVNNKGGFLPGGGGFGGKGASGGW